MIPQHTIDIAAQAIFERDRKDHLNNGGIGVPYPWERQSASDRRYYRKRAIAALRAVGKRIWDSGYEAGVDDTHAQYQHPHPTTTPNPYRSEDK